MRGNKLDNNKSIKDFSKDLQSNFLYNSDDHNKEIILEVKPFDLDRYVAKGKIKDDFCEGIDKKTGKKVLFLGPRYYFDMFRTIYFSQLLNIPETLKILGFRFLLNYEEKKNLI